MLSWIDRFELRKIEGCLLLLQPGISVVQGVLTLFSQRAVLELMQVVLEHSGDVQPLVRTKFSNAPIEDHGFLILLLVQVVALNFLSVGNRD